MSRAAAILPNHLARTALVYIRQSTPKQLLLHQESTRRQYQLAEHAAKLGWAQPRIQIIDDDLGQSGASSLHRMGFQHLVSAIGLGEVGLVLVTEVSRLSRLNSDWHRVLELCAVFETLIADDEGIYDPRDPNDRLLLGLKGTLFAAELHILQARMRQGLLNKARRGALHVRLPVGYRRQLDGTVALDPDEQVQWTLRLVFTQFATTHNARAVQRHFLAEHLLLPRAQAEGVEWVTPSYQMLTQILTNPAYAGMFVYGRRKHLPHPGDPTQRWAHRLPEEEWEIVVSGIYPAYLTEADYTRNRAQLRANMYNFIQRRPGAPREGTALLQGLVLCGTCGHRLQVHYSQKGPRYVCRNGSMRQAAPTCQSFGQVYLDRAVQTQFFDAIHPAHVATLLAAMATLEEERHTREQGWQLRLERARYAVHLAQRQYDAVDPDNRLVARELEKRWNAALEGQTKLEREYAQAQKTDLTPLTPEEQAAIQALAANVPQLWEAPTTTMADRKRLIRTVIQAITLTPSARRQAQVTILWSGEVTTTQVVTCPPVGWHCTAAATLVNRLRECAQTMPDHQIAERLNQEGVTTPTGKPWTTARVVSLRKQHAISTQCPTEPGTVAIRGDGLVATKEVARQLGISHSLVNLWVAHGVLNCEQRAPGSNQWVTWTLADRERVTGASEGGVWPSLREVMRQQSCSATAVWERVRAKQFLPHRCRAGRQWEWHLQPL